MKSSEEMVKSIQDGKSVNFNAIASRLNAPTQTEAVARETEMAQNKILYSAKLDKNLRRSAYFETNKRTFKSNIMLKFVTKAMDIKLRGESNFTTTLEDPIKLLKRIEPFMKKSADAEYDFLDFWEANQKFFAMKQGTTKNLMHFKERFLRQAEVLQDLYGVAWFRDFAVKTKAYAAIASTDTAAQNKFKDGSVSTPLQLLQLAGTTGNQMMQIPLGMQLMQIPTQGGGTVTVPYSMNANGEIAFSGMQLSRQGFAQVRQGFDATQARTPQAAKTGYFDTSNVFHDAIKGKDENGNDVYLIPCPTGTTNVKLQADWHYASEDEDLPDLATEAD
ncbi:unnamed protein product [Cylindrotheca closterium]|uniref:Uncharacterized protein n=1 Tax=Cylindrotheca closterium TaxID=2856 RepID=A0AAD2FKB4_9STRA|nr:unnamed protein product [Cylindrotheca closterium]